MPRKPMDFTNSCIYKICCKDPSIEAIYIGSTTDIVARRHGHKTICNDPNAPGHNRHVYKFIREHGHWENWEMVRIESFPCDGREAMLQREREVFDQLKPSLNTNRPKVSNEERVEQERMLQAEWRAKNPERAAAADKAWRDANPERNRAKIKSWRDANPERVRETKHAWRLANPQAEVAGHKKWTSKRVVCEHCNKNVCQGALRLHQRSKKCVAAQEANITVEPLEVSQVVEST